MSGANRRRPGLLALLALLLFCAVPLRSALLRGEVLFQRDVNMVWLPQAEGALRVLAAPAWPLWDPLPGFGRPLLADPRAELLYPVTWLHLLLAPGTYYTLFCLAHLFLAAAGMYALAREWGCTRPAALAGAGLLAAGGPLLSLAVMWHHLAGAAWLPWLFLALERALARRRRADVVLFALAFALHVLAGSPDSTVLALPALALYALWPRPAARPRSAFARRSWPRRSGWACCSRRPSGCRRWTGASRPSAARRRAPRERSGRYRRWAWPTCSSPCAASAGPWRRR